RVRVPGGSHSEAVSVLGESHTERGDKRQWRRKPRAGRRRPARNAKLTSPVDKRGRRSPPFQFSGLVICTPSHTRTRRITSHCWILSTTSMPPITRPKTV